MFNIGFTELLLILAVAFFVVGPQDLPKVARGLARAAAWARDMFRDLKTEITADLDVDEAKAAAEKAKNVSTAVRDSRTAAQKKLSQEVDALKKDFQDM